MGIILIKIATMIVKGLYSRDIIHHLFTFIVTEIDKIAWNIVHEGVYRCVELMTIQLSSQKEYYGVIKLVT